MSEQDDWAAAEVEGPDRSEPHDPRTGARATPARMREQARWVELQVQRAIERGDFDELPGKG